MTNTYAFNIGGRLQVANKIIDLLKVGANNSTINSQGQLLVSNVEDGTIKAAIEQVNKELLEGQSTQEIKTFSTKYTLTNNSNILGFLGSKLATHEGQLNLIKIELDLINNSVTAKYTIRKSYPLLELVLKSLKEVVTIKEFNGPKVYLTWV